MNITDSKVKFMKNGNIYTLLQKDEDGKVRLYHNGEVINLATKQDAVDNLPNIIYKDLIKIYYYLNGELIQLAVKEDIEYFDTYDLLFNNKNTEITYDDNICVATDTNIILKANATDEEMYIINYNTETELMYDTITQNSLTGAELSIVNLDPTKVVHGLNSVNIVNYNLNNSASQFNRITLLYTEVEEV